MTEKELLQMRNLLKIMCDNFYTDFSIQFERSEDWLRFLTEYTAFSLIKGYDCPKFVSDPFEQDTFYQCFLYSQEGHCLSEVEDYYLKQLKKN